MNPRSASNVYTDPNVYMYTSSKCRVIAYIHGSDAGIHDRVVIQELLKGTAQSQSLETSQREFKGKCFKVSLSLSLSLSLIIIIINLLWSAIYSIQKREDE